MSAKSYIYEAKSEVEGVLHDLRRLSDKLPNEQSAHLSRAIQKLDSARSALESALYHSND
ncbi:hypothetical protein [Bordetella genomosp. 13]|uniref:Uncharacterized protein n=1 Tax=Bordetella genomosp. 13 TaxID=463040 RepID=A0A1W6ZFC0_9BORD|nr:hypothetical protein [Bordetella genomosp. 13]ARP95564.1 hypothetical protein CAL15_14940 [Bordetella genomosp. 13]